MRNCSAWGDYKPDEFCLERSFDGVVHRFRGKAAAEKFYKSIVG